MQIIQNNWLHYFLTELKNTQQLKIISPFISDNMVRHLLNNWQGKSLQIITRFNLNDFRSGVSSLKALQKLLNSNAEIKGIKDLHSKSYIFDSKSIIITSANFTGGGFFRNYELGILSYAEEQISDTINYFNTVWSINNSLLTNSNIVDWNNTISKNKSINTTPDLKDFGASYVEKTVGTKNYFIKFYGTNSNRADEEETVKNQVKGTHCHFAVTFSDTGRRPRRYKNGDVVYMARMLYNNDYAIFGKAIAIEHNDERDYASEEDIEHIDWKEDFPVYIRVHSPQFLNTSFKNCPKLKTLMNELDYESFKSTIERYKNGEQNIIPSQVLMQKPDVTLSEEGAFWLENEFQKVKSDFSLLPQSFIDNLYQGTPNNKNKF